MVGIAGTGMRGLALLLHQRGATIIGTDLELRKIKADPQLMVYQLLSETEALAALANVTEIIYSDAIVAEHPIRVAAVKQQIPAKMLFQAVGELAAKSTTIAVAGTHGKSSTTAFLGHILTEAGLDPTVLLGASMPQWQGNNARQGSGRYFVVEADEYRNHFSYLQPTHLIVTSIEFDHPDAFTSLTDVIDAFATLLRRIPPGGLVITPASVREQYASLPWPASTRSVTAPLTPWPLILPGEHMQSNAELAAQLAEALGVPLATSRQALTSFSGLARRFETIGTVGTLPIISDYGHHPTEIAVTIKAALQRYSPDRLLVIIEPHTTARLTALFTDFVQSLTTFHLGEVIIYPTFAAQGREVASTKDSAALYQAVTATGQPATLVTAPEQLPELLKERASHFDAALAFTAGRLDAALRSMVRT